MQDKRIRELIRLYRFCRERDILRHLCRDLDKMFETEKPNFYKNEGI